MSPNFSLRAGSRLTSSRRPLVVVTLACALAALALNWESAALRVVDAQSGLVAAYNFDEGIGSTAADSSGLGNNGVVSGGASWATAGRYGKAVSFVDRGNIVTVADHPSLDLTTAFTLEAWVRPSSSSNARTVLIKEMPGDLAWALYSNGDGQRPIVWARSGDTGFSALGNSRLSTGVWTHLAATYNGSTLRLYVNGVSVSSRAMTGTLNTSSMALRIGGTTIWDEWYRGLIDDVRIYNRSLSAAEIQFDMATPVGITDTTDPDVTLTGPANGATLSGSVAVSAAATDNVGISGVQFYLDGATLGAEDLTAPYGVTWDTRTAANGTHTLTATGRDAAGNTASSTVTVTVDNPPRLVILQPAGGATITGTTVAISYSSQGDLTEAQHAHFSLDGGPVQMDLSFDGAYQLTNVTAGAHTLTGYLARADHSRIVGSDATPVTFTTVAPDTPPSVSVTAPIAGSTLTGNVTVRADATDDKAVSGVLFLVDGAAVGSEDTVAPYEIVWDSRTTTNGPHAISARARDAAGNTATSTVAITVNNPPRLSILQPTAGGTITATTVTITYTTQGDLTEARQAHFSLDGGPAQVDITLDGAFQISNVIGGAHTLTGFLARADQSQIVGSNATPVTFTTVVPDTPPSVTVTAPLAGSTLDGNVTLRADATDDIAVAGVLFLVDGSPVGNEDTVEPYEIVWDSRTATNSPHAISARARDAAGNTTTSTVAVTVNNPPRLLILQPAGGATITGTTVAISYGTQGDLTGVSHVHFALDGGATLMDMSFDGTYQISNVAPGAHTLTGYLARADHSRIAGTDATPVSFATFVPDTPPSASVTAPLAGSTLSGNVTVRADAADNIGVAGVQFLLDGSALGNEDTVAPYEIVWDSRTTTDGPHAISARARDGAGNTGVSAAIDIEIANIATGPAQVGQWSAPISIPVVAIHQALLPSGQVLMWDAADFTTAPPILFNPQTNTWINRPGVSTDLFCSGHAMLADGRLLVVGGDTRTTGLGVNDVNLFDPTTNAWTTAARMTERRWYPTATTLSDGRVFVMSGYDDCYGPSCLVGRPEIFNPTANTWTPMPTADYVTPSYPFLFETPDGKIISAGSYEGTIDTRVLDLATGTWSVLDSNPIDAGSAVMYAPGKIMKAGKWANSDPPFVPAHANTYVLDLNQPSPQWRASTPMNFARAYNMLTLLPDGTTLATAGSRTTDPGTGGQGVLEAEIWSPDTETWTTMARMQFSRLYHGTSMLLPDGRVLVAGSGRYGSPERFNVEIFSPPYLFKGARPVITAVPALVQPGSTFAVDTPAADIAAVTMVRIGAMTHSFNTDQRFMKLNFTAEPGRLQVEAPSNVHVLLPGYYMLFVINDAGVPSVGAFVRVPVATEDRTAPTAPSGLTATGSLGQATLSWTAATDNVAVTQYLVHRSTTPGFIPSAATLVGTTAGTSYTDVSLAAGVYQYRVVARDAAGNESGTSNEASATVTSAPSDTTAPTVAVTSPASGAVVSGTVTVTATAADNVAVAGVRFLLDGAQLGAEDTNAPYSTAWNTSTAAAGTHQLTAIARDAAGNTTTSAVVTVSIAAAPPPPPATGLVVAIGFDEGAGTTAADISGFAHNAALSNTTWTPSGRFGSGLIFNGTTSWATIADTAALDLTNAMTLSAWVRPTSITSDFRTVLLKEMAPGLAYALYANDGASRPPAGYINTGGADMQAVASANLALNTWTHLAVTYNGTALRLYVNGTLVRTTNTTGSIRTSTGPLRIGGNSVWGEYFAGTIDEVRVYNRVLSATEIQSDMTLAVKPPTP